MTSAVVSTRRRVKTGTLANDDQVEGATYVLSEFPNSADIIEDLQLGVLLGRQVFRVD